MEKLIDKIFYYFSEEDEMDTDKAEIIKYGLEIIILKSIFWITALIIGIIMGCFWESIVYLVMFAVLRSYAGGYHAKSRTRCFIQSIITIVVAMIVLKLINIYGDGSEILLILTVVFSVIIIMLAPVDTANKELETDEYIKFKKRTGMVLAVEISIILATYIFNINMLYNTAMLAVITSGILVVTGHISKVIHN